MTYLDNFHNAPPGVSLVQEPGKWQWEKPPKFTRPIDAVDFITAKFKNPDVKENYLKMLVAGISVEEIVTSLAKGGFVTGHFSPDVAEVIKTPLAFFILGMADDYGIPVRLYRAGKSPEKKKDEMLDDDTLLSLMRRNNPQLYAIYKNKEAERMQKDLRPRTGMLEPIEVSEEAEEGAAPPPPISPVVEETFGGRLDGEAPEIEEEIEVGESTEEEMIEQEEENTDEL